MSQEKTLKNLHDLGFSKIEAQIYLLLGKRGPQKAKDIVGALKINRQHLYEILKELENKGLITSTLEHPTKFTAEPFEKILDLFIKSKNVEAKRLEDNRIKFLSDWQSISIKETNNRLPEKFSVIEGRKNVYSKLVQMRERAKEQIQIISTFAGLMRADQFGLLDPLIHSDNVIKIRFLTELTEQNVRHMKKLLSEKKKARLNIEGRVPELGLKLFSRIIIRDRQEAAIFISNDEKTYQAETDICLWTDCKTLVNSFSAVFEELWINSADIQNALLEIQKGGKISNVLLFQDAANAKAKFEEIIASAKKEIIITISSSELVNTWRKIVCIREANKRGVSVKILAPITREGLEAAIELSSFCQLKHISSTYYDTAIVDGEHLFQFNYGILNNHYSNESVTFENTRYSNHRISVQKTMNMLDEIWRNAISPGTISVEDISTPSLLVNPPVRDDEYSVSRKGSPYQKMAMAVEEKPGSITEEEVLNKILNPKKTPGVTQRYGSSANVVIHPPKYLNLPDMIFTFNHCSKQSTFGDEDYMVIYQWLENQERKVYVPAAILGDNAESLNHLREISFARTPAAKNTIKVEKDQLQIQTYGNRLFAGWTIPIPLLDSHCSIPPASMLFEGYGKIKSATINFKLLSGVKTILEGNGLDAFVTFFLPNYKYAGPGTDGIFVRDFIMTTTYPSPQK